MDCRWCDWYLCRACLPVYQARAPSLWSTIFSLPAYAMDHMSNALWPSAGMGPGNLGRGASRKRVFAGTRQERAACVVVTEFCEAYSSVEGASRAPTDAELESLWAKCRMLPPWPVTEAVCEQLSWVADFTWPPKLRALHAIDHFGAQGEDGKELVDLISERAGKLLVSLTGVPQLKAKTIDVVRNLRERAALRKQSSEAAGICAGVVRGQENLHFLQELLAESPGALAGKTAAPAARQPPLDLLDLPVPRVSRPTSRPDWLSEVAPLDEFFRSQQCKWGPSVGAAPVAKMPVILDGSEAVAPEPAVPFDFRIRWAALEQLEPPRAAVGGA